MRLVLLPGLNGSSKLFAPLLSQLRGIDCLALELPADCPQDHQSLADRLLDHLGNSPFILLGESFSGPLAYQLALRQPKGLSGLIMAASFLQCPNRLATLFSHLSLPPPQYTPDWLLRHYCVDDAPLEVLQLLRQEIRALPSELTGRRLRVLAQLQPASKQLSLPTLHLWPTQDRLVRPAATARLEKVFSHLQQERIDGPHFLLQSRPHACAAAIRRFMAHLGD